LYGKTTDCTGYDVVVQSTPPPAGKAFVCSDKAAFGVHGGVSGFD
jgi:hypothetical protein